MNWFCGMGLVLGSWDKVGWLIRSWRFMGFFRDIERKEGIRFLFESS